jgi:hypothetical protein
MKSLNWCDVLGYLNNTCDVYKESLESKDPYNRIFEFIWEPIEKRHIICVGFVEWSWPYKKVMDMYDEYIYRWWVHI